MRDDVLSPYDAACLRADEAEEALDDLRHYTRRMLQALDAYWLWCEGWNGPKNRLPRSMSTAEDWWSRYEKYRKLVEVAPTNPRART